MSRFVTPISSTVLLPCRCSTLRRQIDAVGRPQEQQHRAAGAIGVDLQLHRLAGGVVALVGNQLQVVEAELRAVETLADDREDDSRLRRVRCLRVGQLVATGGTARPARPSICCSACALGVGVERPCLHGRFQRLAVLVA